MESVRTVRASDTVYRLLQALAVACLLILSVGILKIGAAAYIASSFCGSFVIFLTGRPSVRPSTPGILHAAALGLIFAAVYRLHHGVTIPYFGSAFFTPGAFLGMGTVQLLAIRWIWASPPEKRAALTRLMRAGLMPLLCIGSMIAVSVAAQLTPITYDPAIFAFDLHLDRASASWQIGTLFRAHAWFYALCGCVYNSLPLALSACLALRWREGPKRFSSNLEMALIALGAVGFLLYQICPASGPAYLFPVDFPAHLPATPGAPTAAVPIAPRNGMPSLHVGWTLLLFWNLRTRRVLAPLAAVYLLLTACATLGSGEHYLADLMVAVPFALTVQAAFLIARSPARWTAVIVDGLLTLAWLIAFRLGFALALPAGSPLWTLAGVTVLLPMILTWRSEHGS